MKNKKLILFLIGLLAIAAVLGACTNPSSDDAETDSPEETEAAEKTETTNKSATSLESLFDTDITSLETVNVVDEDMEWRYYDDDKDPNAGTWYEGWNKRNGWAYPEGWLDWGTIPMEFTEEDWPTYEGTVFSTSPETDGQVLATTEDSKAKSTYFLRHTFTLTQEQAESIYALEITARYNDAMTMYINGSPVGGFHNIPTDNYSENMEYGAQEEVADGEFIEETFIVDDVSSITNGYVPGEYEEVYDEENDMITHELSEATTDDDGNTFMNITIAVELHAYDPDDNEASFELVDVILNPDETELAADSEAVKNVSVNTGADEDSINFTWNALSSETGYVEVVEGTDPEAFSIEDATVYEADSTELAYTKFTETDYYTNKATVEVERDTDYLYRVGNEDGYSQVFPLRTQDIADGYEAIFLADAQIGTGTIPTDVFGWEETLAHAFETAPDASMILNAGDFVDAPDKESEYDAYFEPEILASYPTASAVGNHDVAPNYKNHFNEPNLTSYGEDEAGSDYYFTYGNVLYLVLNANNMNNEEHVQFLEETMEETADQEFDWKVLMFHQSIYAAGKQSESEDVPIRRDVLVPAIDESGIDVVLMGHDHAYARTHQMHNFEPVEDVEFEDENQTAAVNPEGTLYITSSSASGSKYYDLVEEYDYLAFREQFYVPTFSHISFTEDTFAITSYRTDTMEEFDSYTIRKSE
ncbi:MULTISPECIES: purple acid phosphatase family protein [Oceanobacillus]|uniref:Calcineurin-like phosphoesterase n=3 Tax=Oceanobacillus TaxID=182709 RepID=A0A0A1MFY0_9BACI|nr:metallophosphoesterase family protein [Oceanobacillus oncorhynchi]CEI82013.1 Calcineurin-like phosphoesterase [Oceanobacillus oncorhynchi]